MSIDVRRICHSIKLVSWDVRRRAVMFVRVIQTRLRSRVLRMRAHRRLAQ